MTDIHALIKWCVATHTNLSPQNEKDWAMFCCALRVLGYDYGTFVALSNQDPGNLRECRVKWQAHSRPDRYADTISAEKKICALAKERGIDLKQFDASASGCLYTPRTSKYNFCRTPTPPREVVYIDDCRVADMHCRVSDSLLYRYLCGVFGGDEVRKVMDEYKVGATTEFSACWGGDLGTAFPLINHKGQCVDIHLMQYDANGHRRQDGYAMNWQMAKDKNSDKRAPWCLFGEHLVADNDKPVALVESEKTALIGAMVMPDMIWCATCGMGGLSDTRLQGVKGKTMLAYPDNGAIEQWQADTDKLMRAGYRVSLQSKIIRKHAIGAKDDIADIIIHQITK